MLHAKSSCSFYQAAIYIDAEIYQRYQPLK